MRAGTTGAVFLLFINTLSSIPPWAVICGRLLTAYIGISVFLVINMGSRANHRRDGWFMEPDDVAMTEALDEF